MDRSLQEKLNDNQIYVGIDPLELCAFDEFADHSTVASEGFYTDFSGVKTRLSYFGLPSGKLDVSVGEIPFPDDGLHAEAIEYLSAIKAVCASKGTFTVVELGAGYGPWITFSGKAAQKAGISKVHLIAVEADQDRISLLRTNLADNALPVPDETGKGARGEASVVVHHGAISDSNGTLSFGSRNIMDWGAAPIEDGSSVDYRGAAIEAIKIPAYTICHIIKDLPSVDFMHVDIQGFEYRSIKASIDEIRKKVRFMLIATHSRKIEGELFELLFGKGWHILHEKPCKFTSDGRASLEALTYTDGTQVWVNTDLEALEKYEVDKQAIRLKQAEYRSSSLESAIKKKDALIWELEAKNKNLESELINNKRSIFSKLLCRIKPLL